jgi:nickel/cobalt transporter (NiCoT) family protein
VGKDLAGAVPQVSPLPTDALTLAALVFLFGVRHGFDPDHLVAIDGLTRSGSRWSGLFFSLGHGAVVTLVGIGVALAAGEWQAPAWLEETGVCISVGVLGALGVANLVAFARARPGEPGALLGIRGRWWAERLANADHPVIIAAIGAAFALSFDTISHALLFSISGASMAGWVFAGALGVLFTLGMALTDTLNGWWVSRLATSRFVGVAIAALCLLLAAAGVARISIAPGPLISIATVAVILVTYVVARRLTRHGTAH